MAPSGMAISQEFAQANDMDIASTVHGSQNMEHVSTPQNF